MKNIICFTVALIFTVFIGFFIIQERATVLKGILFFLVCLGFCFLVAWIKERKG